MSLHDTTQEIPYGYCMCGCGQKAPLAKNSDKRIGIVKGQPVRFIKNHHFFKPVPKLDGITLCECGCGQPAPISPMSDPKRGYVRGKPLRFIRGHYRKQPSPLAERFWGHVDVRGPDDCWEWQGTLSSKGYGYINTFNGKRVGAHRIAWELTNGPIPADMQVLHKCDRRSCCNPAHHFLGTTQDNTKDMLSKGREARGERMGSAKLTDEQVIEIRAVFASGNVTKAALASTYGVTRSAIRKVLSGKTWRHIP